MDDSFSLLIPPDSKSNIEEMQMDTTKMEDCGMMIRGQWVLGPGV